MARPAYKTTLHDESRHIRTTQVLWLGSRARVALQWQYDRANVKAFPPEQKEFSMCLTAKNNMLKIWHNYETTEYILKGSFFYQDKGALISIFSVPSSVKLDHFVQKEQDKMDKEITPPPVTATRRPWCPPLSGSPASEWDAGTGWHLQTQYARGTWGLGVRFKLWHLPYFLDSFEKHVEFHVIFCSFFSGS